MLPRERLRSDLAASIHEVYGEKKEGADFAYDSRWSYNVADTLRYKLRQRGSTPSSG